MRNDRYTAILNNPSAIIGSATHFSDIFSLTYKIPLSYIPTAEKENLINK
jgi:hypothetical protein